MEYHPRPKKTEMPSYFIRLSPNPAVNWQTLCLKRSIFIQVSGLASTSWRARSVKPPSQGLMSLMAAGLPWASQVFHKSWALLDLRNPTDLPIKFREKTTRDSFGEFIAFEENMSRKLWKTDSKFQRLPSKERNLNMVTRCHQDFGISLPHQRLLQHAVQPSIHTY